MKVFKEITSETICKKTKQYKKFITRKSHENLDDEWKKTHLKKIQQIKSKNRSKKRKNYRKLYQKMHNVTLPKDWDIHHIDCDFTNNNKKNLIPLPNKEHSRLHRYMNEYSQILNRKQLLNYLKQNNFFFAKEIENHLTPEIEKLNL